MNRKNFIGGSDIAAVMGLSRWKTALQLWAEKTGEVEPADLSEVEAVQLGTELEEFVAKKFEKETGKSVRRSPQNYTHKKYDFMKCQVDRLVTGTDELLECKTCSAWKAKEWEGEDIPNEYILQVMWQLGITGRKVGWIAVLIGGQAFKYKRIDFDYNMFDKMESEVIRFWAMVESKVPPIATGMDNQILFELHPESNSEIQEAQELESQIALLQEVKMHIQEMEKEKEEIEASIKERIGDNLGIKTEKYIVKWNPQRRAFLDTLKLKLDGLYEQYLISKPMRVLRVTKNKEEA